MWAGGGQRVRVVQGLSTWPIGRVPVRRTRPQRHGHGGCLGESVVEVQAAGGVWATVDHSDIRGLVTT